MRLTLTVILSALLSACGGGGGGGSSPHTEVVESVHSIRSIAQTPNTVYNVATGDLNGDGLDDIVVSGWYYNSSSAYVYVFTQNENGTLTDSTSMLGSNVIGGSQRAFIADFDGDGRNDIFLPGFLDGSTITPTASVMFWNNGTSFTRDTFADTATAHGACIGDLNRDGTLDMVVAGAGIYTNNGSRSFTLHPNVLSNNYFASCAVIGSANNTAVYLGNNNALVGFKDNIAIFDNNLNLQYYAGIATDSNRDTIGVLAVDANSDGAKDFVITANGVGNTSPQRQVVANTGPVSYTPSTVIDNLENDYFDYTITIENTPAMFFAAAHSQARVYKITNAGLVPYKTFSSDSALNAVYQNARTGKVYVLQLVNYMFQTKEM